MPESPKTKKSEKKAADPKAETKRLEAPEVKEDQKPDPVKTAQSAIKRAVEEATKRHRETLEDLRHRMADAENRAKLAAERAGELKAENKKLREAVEPLKAQVSAHAKNILESEKKVQQLKRELNDALKEKDAADRRFYGLENTAEQMQHARDAATAGHREAEKRRRAVEGERDVHKGEVESLRRRVGELERTLRDHKIQLTKE